jgi:hypothetical protein
MNTTIKIESALKAINQAKFERLISHLLHSHDYKFLGAPGAVVGKEKTSKGTPDSFFVYEGKYIYVQCTTKKKIGESKSFFDKLSKDIDDCFNEKKTRIKKEEIGTIILACNEKISVKEYSSLSTKVKNYNSNTNLELLDIQNLPLFIYEVPNLAEEYLDIKTIKGDIFNLEDFLLRTKKGIQPSLINKFVGREDEIKNCIESLKKYDILLLSGGAGVGKTKLAVKLLEELSKDGYIPVVIQSTVVPLWDDYEHLFLREKQYIILCDDANKSITNLEYLLSKLKSPRLFSAKVVITSRDYVRKEILNTLNNYNYQEYNLSDLQDEEIEKIIISALPNLKYYSGIKRRIIDLAKGNARVALMATYSVTTDADTNYLASPVLLYEKYFNKISEDIGTFRNPIILKSLAIVSFFGVFDRSNEYLETILTTKFKIDWDDLWSAILELHNSEVLNVYSNEIVKITDQVLATYIFYKCFIDKDTAIINYAEWIATFIEKYSHKIQVTLIEVNNAFGDNHIRELILPHLNEVKKQMISDDELYAFYNLFWFYKGINCLSYLKTWIKNLPQEKYPDTLQFSNDHNGLTISSKHFELLKNFWNYPNDLLKPSLQLTIELLCKQPVRLPEILKFVNEDFQYKIEDTEKGYLRQNMLFDVLFDDRLDHIQKKYTDEIFLNLAEALLGWDYTENGPTKGLKFKVYSFHLYKTDNLIQLRGRILNQVYNLFESNNEQCQKILNKIVYPDGKIDKSIYVDELSIYDKIISHKLDNKLYAHCMFVHVLVKHLSEVGEMFPENWKEFIESDISRLSNFLIPSRERYEGKSFDEFEKEKQKKFNDFVRSNDWGKLEKFILDIDTLYRQQIKTDGWQVEYAITDILLSIARKNKSEFENALRLFLSGKVQFPLKEAVINVVMFNNIMTGKELLYIMNDYEFQGKIYWESVLVACLPEAQVDKVFFTVLIDTFKRPDENIYIQNMLDYLKFKTVFEEYKKEKPELNNHNIITYLTSLILKKARKTRCDFGHNFCVNCISYFTDHLYLIKAVYWAKYELESYFDYDGNELKAILDLDRTFIYDSIKEEIIGLDYSSIIKLSSINTGILWEYPEYERLIEDLLLLIEEKETFSSGAERNAILLFHTRKNTPELTEKMKQFILVLTHKYYNNKRLALMIIEVAYEKFRDWFIEYYKEFLLLNRDIEVTKRIKFNESSMMINSWIPVYQSEKAFYKDILKMICSLPNNLEYSEHINYFEQRIDIVNKVIEREMEKEFIDEY